MLFWKFPFIEVIKNTSHYPQYFFQNSTIQAKQAFVRYTSYYFVVTVQNILKNFVVNEKTAKIQQQEKSRSLSTFAEKHARSCQSFSAHTSISATSARFTALYISALNKTESPHQKKLYTHNMQVTIILIRFTKSNHTLQCASTSKTGLSHKKQLYILYNVQVYNNNASSPHKKQPCASTCKYQ
jgi:hypothetical protein